MPTTDVVHEAAVKFPIASKAPGFAGLYERLRGVLGPEPWAQLKELLRQAEQAAADLETEAIYSTADGIARHFPGLGPAIRAVAQHTLEASSRRDCGAQWDEAIPYEWVGCLGPVAAGPDAAA